MKQFHVTTSADRSVLVYPKRIKYLTSDGPYIEARQTQTPGTHCIEFVRDGQVRKQLSRVREVNVPGLIIHWMKDL